MSERKRGLNPPKYGDLTTLLDLSPLHFDLAATFNACTLTVHIQRPQDGDQRPEQIHLRSVNSQFAFLETQRFPKGHISYIPENGSAGTYAYDHRQFVPVKISLLFHDDVLKIDYPFISDFVRRDEYYNFQSTGPAELFSVFDCFIPTLDRDRRYPIRVLFKRFRQEGPDKLHLHTTMIPFELAELIVLELGARYDED